VTANTVIPGDPGGLASLASLLQSAAEGVDGVRGRVSANGLPDWTGNAGDAFRASMDRFPGEMGPVSDALRSAGGQLSSFASMLEGFQRTAASQNDQIADNAAAQAQARYHQSLAQTQYDAANAAHQAASDPISLQTAGRALSVARDGLNVAADAVGMVVSEGERIAAEAAANFAAYRRAVEECITTLGGAAPGIASFLTGIEGRVGSIGQAIDSYLATRLHEAGDDAEDLARGDDPLLRSLPVGLLFGAGGAAVTMALRGDDWLQSSLGARLFNDAGNTINWSEGAARGSLDWLAAHGPDGEEEAREWLNSIDDARGQLDMLDDSGAMRVFGGIGYGLTVAGDLNDENRALLGYAGEDAAGRWTASGLQIAGDVALARFPPATLANLLTGGVLHSDVSGLAMIGGGALSGGVKGFDESIGSAETDADSGDYLGAAGDLAGGIGHGMLSGMAAADTQFANEVAAGKFGTVSKWVAEGVNDAPGAVGTAMHDVGSGLADAGSGAKHLVGSGLHDLGL
jgi:hypothetical protein